MADTIYYRLPGQTLTPEEAQEAQATFESSGNLPKNYEFANWSKSSTENDPEPALNAGGNGVVVEDNLTYYPAVELKPPAVISVSGNTLTYTTQAQQAVDIGYLSTPVAQSQPPDSEVKLIDLAILQTGINNNTSGSVSVNTNAVNIRLGLISLLFKYQTNTVQTWSTVVDGNMYYLKTRSRLFYAQARQFISVVFTVYNSNFEDITDSCQFFFNFVDNLVGGQVYTAQLDTLTPKSGTTIEYSNGAYVISGSSPYITTMEIPTTGGDSGTYRVDMIGVKTVDGSEGDFFAATARQAEELFADPINGTPQNFTAYFSGYIENVSVFIKCTTAFSFQSLTITKEA